MDVGQEMSMEKEGHANGVSRETGSVRCAVIHSAQSFCLVEGLAFYFSQTGRTHSAAC